MKEKCRAALFDTPHLWPSSPTFDSKLYSPCAFHSPQSSPGCLWHNLPQVREWPPMMCHHVHDEELVNPEGGPLRYPMALAFHVATSGSRWAA